QLPTTLEGPARGSETVLVVEDMPGLRRLVQRTLEKAGYTVLTASSAADALRLVEETAPPVDLLLTDVVMPGMSGRTLAERLQRLRPAMKVLFMSGYTNDVMVRHNVIDGSTPFISKPFKLVDLTRQIRRTLDTDLV